MRGVKYDIRIVGDFEGQIHVSVADGEARRHYADDRVIFVNELKVASDDRRIAIIMPPPESVT